MSYNVWVEELRKYHQIIQHVKHTLFQRESGNQIGHLITQLDDLIDNCQLTTKKIPGTDQNPISYTSAKLENNISEAQIEDDMAIPPIVGKSQSENYWC